MPAAWKAKNASLLTLWLTTAWSWQSESHDLKKRDWQPNQVNTTLCWWEQPRSAIVRDALYLDGGYMANLPGFANGSQGAWVQTDDGSVLYAINFTQAFKTSQNASEILRTVEKTAGAANNLAPNYLDGMMFANDNEFYLYGGLLRDTVSLQPPPADTVLGYERFQYGPNRESWKTGFYSDQLQNGLTRYVTAGAGVNVPSENLGFYFSGLKNPTGGDIRAHARPQFNATTVATSLVMVDLTTMRSEKWANSTIPSIIPGRANAELVWVPSSEQGLLVAIGGVSQPEWAFRPHSDVAASQSRDTSPGFMKTVSVYDIKSQVWFLQDTSGDIPPQLTQFCSVTATSKDGSSTNAYIYGGIDGLSDTSGPSDDVYILSMPSFTWIKAYSGNTLHGRRSHKCAKVYPDQMLVVGGRSSLDSTDCLGGGIIQIFNLNTLKWQDKYDPTVWSEYKVPALVTSKIGGIADGGATSLQPSKWANETLSSLFGFRYTKTIPTYYPYASVSPTTTSGAIPTRISTSIPTPIPTKSSSLPKWVAPVLGVVLGLALLTASLIILLLLRRRQVLKRSSLTLSETGTSSRGNRILDWIPYPIGSQPHPTNKVSDCSDDSEATTDSGTVVGSASDEKEPVLGMTGPMGMTGIMAHRTHEAGSDPVYEMSDSSPPTELPTSETSDESHLHSFGLSSSPRPMRPRPPLATTSSSSLAGAAGIPRPESPTTSCHSSFTQVPSPSARALASPSPEPDTSSFFPNSPRAAGGHSRQVSSIDTTPASQRGHHRQVSSLDSTAERVGRESEDGDGERRRSGQVVSPELGEPGTRSSAPVLGSVRESNARDGPSREGGSRQQRRRESSFSEDVREH